MIATSENSARFTSAGTTMSLARHPFDLLMELPDSDIHLDCALLQAARDVFPDLNIAEYRRQLDYFADEVSALRPGLSSITRYEAMREVLVEEYGFTGNEEAFYDPDNSYLNKVLDRRTGIPISLSVIWIEVGRRLKWPIAGIAFPGHFLVRFEDEERLVVADPFNEGRSLSIDDCRALLAEVSVSPESAAANTEWPPLRPEHLVPCSKRTLMARALGNLRMIYTAQEEWSRLGDILRRLAAVEPHNGAHLCELASLHARLGDMKSAYAHLLAFLERTPNATNARQVRSSLRVVERAILALN